MLLLRPRLHDLVGSAASRTVQQLHELGVDVAERRGTVAVVVASDPSPGRLLLAATLIDQIMRLDPLVDGVVIDIPGREQAVADELGLRIPIEVDIAEPHLQADLTVVVGHRWDSADLVVDGVGWVAAIGQMADVYDDGNPVGPLCAACLGSAEIFKVLFQLLYVDRPFSRSLHAWEGAFSFFDYSIEATSPPLAGDVRLDATLVGAGGVGAGFVTTIGALHENVSGRLRVIDHDQLEMHNLNRVGYASLESALAESLKVDEVVRYLAARCPGLVVERHPISFDGFKRLTPRRDDRIYELIVSGVDSDDTRWDIQRDLPRVLIDGSTGRDMNSRVERVQFGEYGCLGCTRPPMPVLPDVDCDAPPDRAAPSLSFVSAFPGIVAAGEAIKESCGEGNLIGTFDHVFRFGPNTDFRSTAAFSDRCQVNCQNPSKLAQFRRKYPTG